MHKSNYLPITIGLGTIGLATVGYLLAKDYLTPQKPRLALARGEQLATKPLSVLAISAHPDDLEFFAGGFLHRLALAGSQVIVIDVTKGEKSTNVENLREIRQKEQEQAANIMGYRSLYFLHLPDLGVQIADPAKYLADIWKKTQPDMVLTFDPEHPLHFIKHPDHRAVGAAIQSLVCDLDFKGTVIYYGTSLPNVSIDITDVIETKVEAILAHKSQIRLSPPVYARLIKGYHRLTACRHARYVEAFHIVHSKRS